MFTGLRQRGHGSGERSIEQLAAYIASLPCFRHSVDRGGPTTLVPTRLTSDFDVFHDLQNEYLDFKVKQN